MTRNKPCAVDSIKDFHLTEGWSKIEPITRQFVKTRLPFRDPNGHKGDFGKVYIAAGSTGYTGAPVYAAEAAMRTGSGLVFLGVPREVYPIVAARCESAMAQPLPDYPALAERMRGCDAVLIGPGLGRGPETEEMVLRLLRDLEEVPVILDADGINAVSAHMDVLDARRGVTVLRPHEGEFARLDPAFRPGVSDRAAFAEDFSARHRCTLVLKGPGTLVASGGLLYRNPTGCSGMAKGGSGDILAGMVLSLIGQGAAPVDAAACAVWLHGRAGEIAEAELTARAMTPPDLLGRLSAAFKELEED